MDQPTPPIQSLSTEETRECWPDLLARIARNDVRLIVEEDGTPVAAVVSAEDYAVLSRLEARRKAAFAVIEQMSQAFADVPDDELEREIEQALAEVRAENSERAVREMARSR